MDVRVEARDNTVLEGVGVANKITGNTGTGNVTLTPQSAVVVSSSPEPHAQRTRPPVLARRGLPARDRHRPAGHR